jgi:hypothetical protein
MLPTVYKTKAVAILWLFVKGEQMYRTDVQRVISHSIVYFVLILLSTVLLSVTNTPADIADRKREPVVVKASAEKFPLWIDSVPARELELWAFRNAAWELIPYQIDEVSLDPVNVRSFIESGAPGRFCVSEPVGDLPGGNGPCEFVYDLRGSGEPTGIFTTNDEIVFLAGHTGACDISRSSWPVDYLENKRYMIEIEDSAPGGSESGCVYLFHRPTMYMELRPVITDLIEYDPIGDNVPSTANGDDQNCLPSWRHYAG